MARVGRRVLAVGVDWALASAISAAFLGGDPWGTLAVFGLAQLVLVGTLGMGVGHALLGMRVVRLDGGWAGPGRAAVRTLLLCLAVPALVWDRDQRGMHDRAAGTVLVLRGAHGDARTRHARAGTQRRSRVLSGPASACGWVAPGTGRCPVGSAGAGRRGSAAA